jgi:putative ABC transport system permease protein
MKHLWLRLRLFLWRDRASEELEEEMRLHQELRAASLSRAGADPGDASHRAQQSFGNRTRLQQESRDAWGFVALDTMRQDLRYAIRRLKQRPAFTASIVIVLALGIGATTAIFSAVDAAMLRPLPFVRPQELVSLPRIEVPFDPGPGQPHAVHANHMTDINDVASMTAVFAQVAAWASGGLNLSDPQQPRRLNAGVVTAQFFNMLGIRPLLGRGFAPEEGKPGNTHVVVLSYDLWQRQFGGRDMLGQPILLNGRAYQVIGVMPRNFSFPKQSDLWIPMSVPTTFETFEPFRGFLNSEVIARVAPGVSVSTAAAQLLARWRLGVARDPAAARETNLSSTVAMVQRLHAAIPLQQSLMGDRRTALFVLLGATALLLLIACANVTNLLLSQAISRRREMAVREVLGATRRRVIRQLLTESTLLALAGAFLGLAVAPLSMGLLRTLLPAGLTGVAPAEIDLRVLAFATIVALITGIAFGLWPALRTTSHRLSETIKAGGGHGSSASGTGRGRQVLVAVELALTLILLIGAALMLRSFRELMRLDGGLTSARVGTLELSFPASNQGYTSRLKFVNDVLERVAATPGITAAGFVNTLPLGNAGGILLSITVDGMPEVKDDQRPGPLQLYASSGYFRAIGMPIIAGRSLTPADDSLAPSVAVINETMAKMYWPGVNPIGRTFQLFNRVTVVGIAHDVRESRLSDEPLPQMYLSIYTTVPATIALVARGALPPAQLLAAMQAAVRSVDPSQAVYHLRTMAEVTSASVAPRRTNTLLISLFAGLALLLASLGVYAVVSHGVSQRSREFGIRTALGATGNDLVSLISREMIGTVVAGLVAGLVGAWALTHLAESMFFGVQMHDTATFVLVPLALLVPAVLATILPARRALRVNPAEVMRAD